MSGDEGKVWTVEAGPNPPEHKPMLWTQTRDGLPPRLMMLQQDGKYVEISLPVVPGVSEENEPLITDEDVREAEKGENLSPAYFAAQRHASTIVREILGEELLKALAGEAAKKVSEAVFDRLSDFCWDGGIEHNMQLKAYQMVDEVIAAILSGNEMYARRYALAKYDQQGVRKAVAEMIGDEVAKQRIRDLEEEIERLREDNRWLRRFA